jgi:hypothetical protein
MMNPIGLELEKTEQQLTEERYNQFVSTFDMSTMDKVYAVDINGILEFSSTENPAGEPVYTAPTVYGLINSSYTALSIAKDNNVETLWYNAVPTRVEYADIVIDYTPVIETTTIGLLDAATINDLAIEGHLYITVSGNSTWEYQFKDQIFYSKIHITGTTRKGTEVHEVVPISYNGTFKTLNQWAEITEVSAAYLDETASITIECLPFAKDSELDLSNIACFPDGGERFRFLEVADDETYTYLRSKCFSARTLAEYQIGNQSEDTEYDIALFDTDNTTAVSVVAVVVKQNSPFVFGIDGTNFYSYNQRLPYPDVSGLYTEDPETKFDIYSEQWVCSPQETVMLRTRNTNVNEVPFKHRWSITAPDDTLTYLTGWVENTRAEVGQWDESWIEITPGDYGTFGSYVINFETQYYNDSTLVLSEHSTKFLLYCPKIAAEHKIALADSELQSAENLSFDSDSKLWFLKNDKIYLANIYYDYFLVDYEKGKLYLRENYSSVKVSI